MFFGVLTTICADPDPKKYNSEVKDKNKPANTTLTFDEKKFLRDVEAKFGIQSNSPRNEKHVDITKPGNIPPPGRFPAVIAIEIVNDTDSKTKGKRTIDANLGYGYKTNQGYTYSYFGKPAQEKGKFMIYPYSQEDNTAGNVQSFHTVHHYENPNGNHVKTSVEIQPSQAFELVAVKDEKSGYNYNKPSVEFKTPSPTPSRGLNSFLPSKPSSTLFTTYNGDQLTGLSGQFPTVMPNYLVDPSQLLKNPEYQSVGLTQDHLRSSHIEQKVVPVLVLRIPSSSLTNPTAELYANLPQNYPLSNYLNNLNLQQLVNEYFKKMGYNTGPRVTAYSSPLSSAGEESASAPVSEYETQHYAHPHAQTPYTKSHSSGVQYSAVQPVMAKYPSHSRPHYTVPKGQSLYNQHSLPQNFEYQYVPQQAVSSQNLYIPSSHYQQQTEHEHVASQNGYESLAPNTGHQEDGTHVQYEVPTRTTSYHTTINHDTPYAAPQEHSGAKYENSQGDVGVEYVIAQPQGGGTEYGAPEEHVRYEIANGANSEYSNTHGENSHSLSGGYGTSGSLSHSYGSEQNSHIISQEYYSQNTKELQQDAHSAYPSQDAHSAYPLQDAHSAYPSQDAHSAYPSQDAQSQITQADLSGYQKYIYEQQKHGSHDHNLILTENYPSKDHTIATVLPAQYANNAGKENAEVVQTVSYVTPMPHSKYKIPYQVMVPQTYIHNPSTEKVQYVHSQSIPGSHNPEAEYTTRYNFSPPIGKQKNPHPYNYHSHPKRVINKREKPRRMIPKNKRHRPGKKRL